MPRPARLLLAPVLLLPVLAAGPARADSPPAVPTPDHVVTVFMENENAASTFEDHTAAPNLAKLMSQGAYVPQYYGAGHASLDNYIAAFSAQQPVTNTEADCAGQPVNSCLYPDTVPTLATTFDAKGVTWKSYAEGMNGAVAGGPCLHAPSLSLPDPYQGPGTNGYATRHNPPMWFNSVLTKGGSEAYCQAHDVDLTELTSDLAKNTLPQWSFVTPDTCHDGHDTGGQGCFGDPEGPSAPNGVAAIDAWLPGFVTQLTSSPAWTAKSVLIITFDEALTTDAAGCAACHDGSAGGRIGALFLGGQVKPGFTSAWNGDHYGLVKTFEAMFGLPTLASLAADPTARASVHDADAGVSAVTDIWTTSKAAASKPVVTSKTNKTTTTKASTPKKTTTAVKAPSRSLAATGLQLGIPAAAVALLLGGFLLRRRSLGRFLG